MSIRNGSITKPISMQPKLSGHGTWTVRRMTSSSDISATVAYGWSNPTRSRFAFPNTSGPNDDINQDAVELVKTKGVKAYQSDLFENVEGKFDLIIFNPPYLPKDKLEDKESKKKTTGGKFGYEILEKFFSQVNKYLNKNGKILIVFSSLTNKNKIDKIINENNFKFKLLEEEKVFFETLYCYLIER